MNEPGWRASPQNPLLGEIAKALRAYRDSGESLGPFRTQPGSFAEDMVRNAREMLLGQAPEEYEELSYGNKPMHMPDEGPRVPQFKKGRAQSTIDALGLIPDPGTPAAMAAGAIRPKGKPFQNPEGIAKWTAEKLFQSGPFGGGTFSVRDAATIDAALQKHIERAGATETDPLRNFVMGIGDKKNLIPFGKLVEEANLTGDYFLRDNGYGEYVLRSPKSDSYEILSAGGAELYDKGRPYTTLDNRDGRVVELENYLASPEFARQQLDADLSSAERGQARIDRGMWGDLSKSDILPDYLEKLRSAGGTPEEWANRTSLQKMLPQALRDFGDKKWNNKEWTLAGTEPVPGQSEGWRKITTPEGLKREGMLAGHCVGGYCDELMSGLNEFYSYRNPKSGHPNVTVQAEAETNREYPDMTDLVSILQRNPNTINYHRNKDLIEFIQTRARVEKAKNPDFNPKARLDINTLRQWIDDMYADDTYPAAARGSIFQVMDSIDESSTLVPTGKKFLEQAKGKANSLLKPEYQLELSKFLRSTPNLHWNNGADYGGIYRGTGGNTYTLGEITKLAKEYPHVAKRYLTSTEPIDLHYELQGMDRRAIEAIVNELLRATK